MKIVPNKGSRLQLHCYYYYNVLHYKNTMALQLLARQNYNNASYRCDTLTVPSNTLP